MRFVVMVKTTSQVEAGQGGKVPDKEMFEEMGRFNMELAKAGMLLAMDGLKPTSNGARIRFGEGKKRTVTDGPFTESKELVAGFWIIQAKSKEEAIAWMSRVPFEDGEIEIREIWERSDFPDVINPERRAELEALMDRANAERKSA
jgi:hypothetical protein